MISSVLVLLVTFVLKGLFITVDYLRRVLPSIRALKAFPLEKPHWLYGHLKVHPGSNHEGLMTHLEWTRKHPRYFVLMIGPLRAALFLNHPETVRLMLHTAEPKNVVGGGGYSLLSPWIGDGLLLSSGQKWFRNRKLLTPGFHFDVLKPYVQIVSSCTDVMLDKFEAAANTAPGRSQEIYAPVSLCTLDIILKCAFSTTKPIQSRGSRDPYVSTVSRLGAAIIKRARNPLMYFDTLYYRTRLGGEFRDACEYSHRVAEEVISERKRVLMSGGSSGGGESSDTPEVRKHPDFLDILLLAKDDEGKGTCNF